MHFLGQLETITINIVYQNLDTDTPPPSNHGYPTQQTLILNSNLKKGASVFSI